MKCSAFFSPCGCYRYELRRVWDITLPTLVFIMLNPSKAGRKENDPTIRKCIGFATRNGYGSILVLNLFAYCATHPSMLVEAAKWGRHVIVGPDNDKWLLKVIGYGHDICVAWGANVRTYKELAPRAATVMTCLQLHSAKVLCLQQNADGIPMHPLMLPYSLPLKEYRNAYQ